MPQATGRAEMAAMKAHERENLLEADHGFRAVDGAGYHFFN